MEIIIRATQAYIKRNHGMLPIRCEVRRMNPKVGQRCASQDPGRRNQVNNQFQIAQSGNYGYSSIKVTSVGEVKIAPERLPWFKQIIQTASDFIWVNNLCVRLRLEICFQCSKNQKQNLKPNVTYWPSTEPSIKKQVHLVEDIGISPWPVDGLNLVQMQRPQEADAR